MDAAQIRAIVSEEIRSCIGGYVKEFFMWAFLIACAVLPSLWYSYAKEDSSSFSYCPPSKPEEVLVKQIKTAMKAVEKEKEDEAADEKFLEDCGTCSDASVVEKVKKIQEKRETQ